MRNPNFEITTQMGCRVNCLKYCPQEVFIKTYRGSKMLTFDAFARFIKDVPAEYPIIFSGLSEPFQNQNCSRMIRYAHEKGHKIIIFSTLVGLTPEHAEVIKDIPFERFTLHLPDPYGIANIPDTPEYCRILNIILRNVERLWFMDMGYYFVSDNSERRVRGTYDGPIRKGRVMCDHLEVPDYFVLPNGDAYFCCQTRGQVEKVGNLYRETYQQLLDKFPTYSNRMQRDPLSICHQCAIATPYWLHPVKKMFGARLIEIGKRYMI